LRQERACPLWSQPGTGALFRTGARKRAKTDPIDAAVIAYFAEATNLQLRQLPDATTQLLAELVALQRQIVAEWFKMPARGKPEDICGIGS
jgi:hypothetical protein